jgi:hypothetical protein
MSDSNQESFPRLDIPKLKEFARTRWNLKNLPLNNITLYRYFNKQSGMSYPVYAVVFGLDVQCMAANERKIIKTLEHEIAFAGEAEDKNGLKETLGIDGTFKDVYKEHPTDDYLRDWDFFFWINDQPMPDGVMVDEPHSLLFDSWGRHTQPEPLTRDENRERDIWNRRIKPIVDKYDIKNSLGEKYSYDQYFESEAIRIKQIPSDLSKGSNPHKDYATMTEQLENEELKPFALNKLLKRMTEVDIYKMEKQLFNLCNGLNSSDFSKEVLRRLYNDETEVEGYWAGQTKTIHLKNLFSAFLENLFKKETLPYFLKCIDMEVSDLKDFQAQHPELPRRPRPSQRHKKACREIAGRLWKEDPHLTIAAMILKDDINAATEGKVYAEATLWTWIHELCPDRSPGRRPLK